MGPDRIKLLSSEPDHPWENVAHFASRDQLHPNDLGYNAMANAIDLALFKKQRGSGSS